MSANSNIANAGNVIVPAYLALRSKGYDVRWDRHVEEEQEAWYADGPLGRFTASDPLSLLGLISMREVRGQNWRASDEEIEGFLSKYEREE